MEEKRQIEQTRNYVAERLAGEASGHDWWHIVRVTKMAERLAKEEGGDSFVCQMAALLHDLADEKLVASEEEGLRELASWLDQLGVSLEKQEAILSIISSISYKAGQNQQKTLSLEGMIVQDADRLDALGAIGIARTMAYSGNKGRLIHDPNFVPRTEMTLEEYRSEEGTAIGHFYEKLLKLKDLMQTETGKKCAEERHAFLELYLQQFFDEWEGKRSSR